MANPGNTCAVYFMNDGLADLDLRELTGSYTVQWLDVMNPAWSDKSQIEPVI